jgi:hypothetical protein
VVAIPSNNRYLVSTTDISDDYLLLTYFTDVSNQTKKVVGKRKYSLVVPKLINRDIETFEVIGLLQAEMSKVQNGCVQFANHEIEIMNQILRWFEREFNFDRGEWKWYIKLNINKPIDIAYKELIEAKVTDFWMKKTKINKEKPTPNTISYISKTTHKKLKFHDYGTLIIEHKNNLLNQTLRKLVKEISYSMVSNDPGEIKAFMRGVIAGKSHIEFKKLPLGIHRVSISATNSNERFLFQNCLQRLGIESKICPNSNSIMISRKHNLMELFNQNLMCRSRKKYNKFLKIIRLYNN